MTGDPDLDAALAEMESTVDRLRRVVRRLRLWAAVSVIGVLLALIAVAAIVADVHHSAEQRDHLRCVETVDRTAAIADAVRGAVDDVMGAIADQIATDAETVEVVETIRDRVDRRLSMRFDQIPDC